MGTSCSVELCEGPEKRTETDMLKVEKTYTVGDKKKDTTLPVSHREMFTDREMDFSMDPHFAEDKDQGFHQLDPRVVIGKDVPVAR
mmetsp:Transcript_31571/g.69123  ORF Transcript_31571/g.69123 Transcript_31571/m.69123 type:complete len:86 (-) Transcript_31571:354-611(-)|eukprot:CAMPEP_0204363132 /NCGR_PEP_ID=MMETSP0469-20131031/40142_1 /ASSEMBLY_ACC=CAM_ASM_000384 /TAXON_ID=2969 /ORGANISM="Oxyrrhis marina" /LENGTH=85 /DNA_ID=CAMNT_0051351837 /DNA_START=26 /DNA_END=283 /DNA_ORIENTATION=+